MRAAELNFVAGRKAKASTAYASASNYLAAGIAGSCPDEGGEKSYDLTLGLFLERAECGILNSRSLIHEGSDLRGEWPVIRGSSHYAALIIL